MTYEKWSFEMLDKAEHGIDPNRRYLISQATLWIFLVKAIVYALNNIACAIREKE